MAHKKKSWIEKRDQPATYEVKVVDKDFAGMKAGQLMLIATPRIIDDYVRQIPPGHLVDPKTMREDLALEYRAETTCPVTTGIFLRIVAEAAYEEYQQGKPKEEITPFWRAIAPKAKAADKLTFGKDLLLKMHAEEDIGN
ncbi:MAG: hypothetical protein KDC54_04100 [Lewinella sp.]|nr:hypothetical protein [Lewinella sp.]